MLRRHLRNWTVLATLAALAGIVAPVTFGAPSAQEPLTQPGTLSFFGVNGYFTGYERSDSEVNTLLPMGPAIDVRWTREEIVWVHIEPGQDSWDYTHYDDILGRTASSGYGIIGMLLTTPGWARKSACSGSYWCPPANVWDYGDFVQHTVERYDGDGLNDAPGSPRVAYWEIWNEPNFPQTWWPYGFGSEAERQAHYGDLLHAGYQSVKAADPTAQVIIGSVYVWDGASYPAPVYDGLAWLGQVQLRHPDICNDYDILGIHPHMPDAAPDDWDLGYLVTMMGRLDNAMRWDTDHGCAEKPAWITEVAWSTCTGCGSWSKTQDQQANYLLRTHALAAARGIQHVNVFQLEDKFDGGPGDTWGNCAIVTQAYTPKTAYNALAVMVDQINGATYVGNGPVMATPNRYDYRFTTPAGDLVDIIWRADEASESPAFPVEPGYQPFWVTRDGARTTLTPSGGYVYPPISGAPGYLRQERPAILHLSTDTVGWLVEPEETPLDRLVYVTNAGAGTLNWTALVDVGSQYFSVQPASGTAPSTLVVSAQPQSAVGYYTGRLVVNAGTAGQATVLLTLTVPPQLFRAYLPVVGVER